MSDFPDDQTRLLNFLLENGPPLERAYYSAIGRAVVMWSSVNVIFADREEAIEGVSFKATKDGHELHRRQMTLLDLNAFAADCEALNLRLLALSSSIQHLTRDRPAPLTLK